MNLCKSCTKAIGKPPGCDLGLEALSCVGYVWDGKPTDEMKERLDFIEKHFREALAHHIGEVPGKAEAEARLSKFYEMPVELPDYDEKTGTATIMRVALPMPISNIEFTIEIGEATATSVTPEEADALVMEYSSHIQEYRALEKKRLDIMAKNNGEDSEEEDAVLEESDDVWLALSEAERDYLNTHDGPCHDETVRWIDLTARTRERHVHPLTPADADACHVVARLIESYMDVGQPGNDCMDNVHDWTPKDEKKLVAAFEELIDELDNRSVLKEGE